MSGKVKPSTGSSSSGSSSIRSSKASSTRGSTSSDEVEVERAAAGLLGVQVDLPRLAQRVGLDEVAFVVHVEPVVDRVVLEIGDEAGDVDDGQAGAPVRGSWRSRSAAREPGQPATPAHGTATVAPWTISRCARCSTRPRQRSLARSVVSGTGVWPEPEPVSTARTWPPTPRPSRCSTGPVWVSCRRSRGATGPRSSSPSSSIRWTGRPTPAAASPGTPPACVPSTPTGRGRRSWSTWPPVSASRPSEGPGPRATANPSHRVQRSS